MESLNEISSLYISSNSKVENLNFSVPSISTIDFNNTSSFSLNINLNELDKLTELKCCRCIFCKQFPLIFYYERYFFKMLIL